MTYESQPPPGLPDVPQTPELAALLAAAQRTETAGRQDVRGEERALAAFRAARDEGAYAAAPPWWRRRGRDDWRPAAVRRGVRSTRLMLGGFALTVTLGGVAVAAGSGALPTPFGGGPDAPDSVRPVHSAPATPERQGQSDGFAVPEGATATPDGGRSTGSEDTAQRDLALCRAYRRAAGHGKAADATAFERLETAAGGESAVPAYCDRLLGQPDPGRTKNSRKGTAGEEDEEKVKEKAPEPAGPAPDTPPGNGNEGGNGNSDSDSNSNGNAGRGGGG